MTENRATTYESKDRAAIYVDRLSIRGLRDHGWRVTGTVIMPAGYSDIVIAEEYETIEELLAALASKIKD